MYSKPNKCIIDLNLNLKINLNQTLKSQKSNSISSSTKGNNTEIAYKIVKNSTSSKIINLELNKKININISNSIINNSNFTTSNNDIDMVKNKEKEKKKIITAFNSILNITNNKSRNQQPHKKNSLENKTAENAPNKIFYTNHHPKLENNKTKQLVEDTKVNNELNVANNTNNLASKNILQNKIDSKQISKIVIRPKHPCKGKFILLILVNVLNHAEIKKDFTNTSKSKLLNAKINVADNSSPVNNVTINKNLFNTSKKIDKNIKKNVSSSIIKISNIQQDKCEKNIKLNSNFLNFSKNLHVSKKL